MPVFHDDQHGTAIIVGAALLNATKLRGTPLDQLRVTINGGGAAGVAVSKLLLALGVSEIVVCDRAGAIYLGREEHMDFSEQEMAELTNPSICKGSLAEVIKESDVFIGLSAPGVLTQDMIRSMAPHPIVFALANPTPEIMPKLAREAGAFAIATGRSDYPNQVNNSLAFPGVFRGALDVKAREVNDQMKLAAAQAIADLVLPGGAHSGQPHPGCPRSAGAPAGRSRRSPRCHRNRRRSAHHRSGRDRSPLPRPRLRRHPRLLSSPSLHRGRSVEPFCSHVTS